MLTKEEKIKILAERAADLWIQQMESGHWDNGDNSSVGGMASMLGLLLMENARKGIREESKEYFKTSLVDLIIDKQPYFIGTDYAPDLLLSEALANAGINSATLPVKSAMWIVTNESEDDYRIRYQFGYSGRSYQQRIEGNTLTEPVQG